MSETEEFTFFWDGPFSQWHPSMFDIDGVVYNTAEQYMMSEKARFFNDKESRDKIMASDSPREQKAIGRKVKNFDADKWNGVSRNIVYKGNMAKFRQNKDLRTALFNTKGSSIVEASPYDKIWGIGMGEEEDLIHDRSQWKGLNWLGETLDRVRDDLLKEFNI